MPCTASCIMVVSIGLLLGFPRWSLAKALLRDDLLARGVSARVKACFGFRFRRAARTEKHLNTSDRLVQVPGNNMDMFVSNIGPPYPSRCGMLVLLCILVVGSAPELDSGNVCVRFRAPIPIQMRQARLAVHFGSKFSSKSTG
jgi:hypothetical protein